ncbi:RING finger and SPRY domain-containing protein 1-like [Artemia franciscana]|uniref:RING finger and SPRY domain-containing protein 1 n=1 Tax=Artemia franciscana TaxID=6661 RepID=A0AA88H6A7_ARTSF|nr:hypothetical protein QYM36_015813 [Artemia franciscana]
MGQCCSQVEESRPAISPDSPVVRSKEELSLLHILPPSEVRKMKKLYPSVKKCILEELHTVETVSDHNVSSDSMQVLEQIASTPSGWFLVLYSLVEVVPAESELGPAVISLIIESCPLPSKDSIGRVPELFWLSARRPKPGKHENRRHKNIAIVLGALAERLAGPNSVVLLSDSALDYLIANLDVRNSPNLILFSIIALEKFAKTSDNMKVIKRRLNAIELSPLVSLEKWRRDKEFLKRHVGFCAEWCLDNIFVPEHRVFTYIQQDMSNINAILNSSDVGEYLKLSADGLEARNDVVSFESARCTFAVNEGRWFYEVEVLTGGIMQIGWATLEAKFLNHDGYGTGDDENSIAFDGSRKLIWYNALPASHSLDRWKPGDIVGCFLDLESQEIDFALNGKWTGPQKEFFNKPRTEVFAAVSLMAYQQAVFNFGDKKFSYPPDSKSFKTFNASAILEPNEKLILPRPIKLELIRNATVPEDCCALCCERKADTLLSPCLHSGFCQICAGVLDLCPLCRLPIAGRESVPKLDDCQAVTALIMSTTFSEHINVENIA